jgi:hypothetical protein
MAQSAVQIRTTSGGDPVRLVMDIQRALEVTEDDIRESLEAQRTRILDRTAQGLDFEGKSFAPYSERGPYYHYPSTQRGKLFAPRQQQLDRIWDNKTTFRAEYFKVLRASAKRLASKLGRNGATTPGGGVRFDSYGEFKRSLGRPFVDLMGRSGNHMLRAMVVKVRSALEGSIGIYGQEAERASGHHEGNPRTGLPRRRFLGASTEDKRMITEELAARAAERARDVLES